MAIKSKVAIEVEIKNIKQVADLKNSLKDLRKEQKEAEKYAKSGKFTSKEQEKAYIARAKAVDRGTKALRDMNKALKQNNTDSKKVTKSSNGMAKQFIKGAAAIGVVVGAFRMISRVISSVVSVFTEFEFVMAKVNAVSGATDSQFKALNETAEKLGRTTFFTATQVGELMLNFSKLGFSANEIQNAVKPTLDLATATGSDLARAATVAGSAIRGFGLDADQTGRVTDVMAVSFSQSAMDIEKWQTSMTKVAPIAKAAGFSIEDTAAIMSKLADSGIEASIAGTSLRNILLKMQDPTSDLSQAFGGTIHSLDELVPAMKSFVDEGGDMADILQVVDLRQAAAFEQMLSNTDGMIELRNEMKESSGEAARMAQIIGDTLQGSFLKFTSAIQGLSIGIMKDFVGGLQSSIEKLAKFTNFLTDNSKVITTSIKVIIRLAKYVGVYKLLIMALPTLQRIWTATLASTTTVSTAAAVATNVLAGAMGRLKLAFNALVASTGIGLVVIALTEGAMALMRWATATDDVVIATEEFIEVEGKLQKIVDDTNTIMNQRYADTKKGAEDAVQGILSEIQERKNLLNQGSINLGTFLGQSKVMSKEEKDAYDKSISRLNTRLALETRNLTEITKRDFIKSQQEKDLLYIQEKKLKNAKAISVTNEKDLVAKNKLVKSIGAEISRLKSLGIEKKENNKKSKVDNTLAWAKVDLMKEVLAGTKNLKDAERELRNMALLRLEADLASLPVTVMNGQVRLEIEQKIIDLKLKNQKETEKGAKKEAKTREDSIKDLSDLGSALQEVAGENKALNGVKKAGEAITRTAAIAESILNLEKSIGVIIDGKSTVAKLLGIKTTIASTAATAAEAVVETAAIVPAVALGAAKQAKLPFPWNLVAIAGTIAVLGKIMGMFEDGGIISDGKKFANGGMVHGASHANGGVKFAVGGRVNELEGGEAVINKRSTAMFRNELSSMNEQGGGVKFADGGLTSSPAFTESQFNASNQSQMIGAMNGQRKVVVLEADITDSQSTVSVIQANATF